jgi:hypothetical protein
MPGLPRGKHPRSGRRGRLRPHEQGNLVGTVRVPRERKVTPAAYAGVLKRNGHDHANLDDHLEGIEVRSQGAQGSLGTLAVPDQGRFHSPAQGYDQHNEEDGACITCHQNSLSTCWN